MSDKLINCFLNIFFVLVTKQFPLTLKLYNLKALPHFYFNEEELFLVNVVVFLFSFFVFQRQTIFFFYLIRLLKKSLKYICGWDQAPFYVFSQEARKNWC